MNQIELRSPYLIFLGSETNPTYAKTGAGVAHWRPEDCLGQFHLTGGSVDLGLPEMTIEQAAEAGAKSLLIGTAVVGGAISDSWLDALEAALRSGMDVVAGVHTRLSDIPRLAQASQETGSKLIDVRVPPKGLPVGNGKRRSGKRVLTVGTDCALGKKYTALALTDELTEQGAKATFRASGQTGIMISGAGIPIDAVVSDFVSGAAEVLSPENEAEHWDVIEGQGSLHHPGYAAVSVGLLLGSQPDAFVVCHEAGRKTIEGWPDYELPSIGEVIERAIELGRRTNPAIRPVGISVNTSSLSEEQARSYLDALEQEYDLPATDPIRFGIKAIANKLISEF
ncbi:MAG: DUF1611 domain-containing protein [Aquiluna sp.]